MCDNSEHVSFTFEVLFSHFSQASLYYYFRIKAFISVWLGLIFTRDALKGHTVSKNGSISFFFFFSFYAGCPEGAYRV